MLLTLTLTLTLRRLSMEFHEEAPNENAGPLDLLVQAAVEDVLSNTPAVASPGLNSPSVLTPNRNRSSWEAPFREELPDDVADALAQACIAVSPKTLKVKPER